MTGTFDNAKVSSYFGVLGDLYGNELGNRERTWLDIGCGHGEFLVALQQFSNRQVTARGLEPNRDKQKSAINRGLEVSYFDLHNHM
jgi:tRNA G46 methylase TrmB